MNELLLTRLWTVAVQYLILGVLSYVVLRRSSRSTWTSSSPSRPWLKPVAIVLGYLMSAHLIWLQVYHPWSGFAGTVRRSQTLAFPVVTTVLLVAWLRRRSDEASDAEGP